MKLFIPQKKRDELTDSILNKVSEEEGIYLLRMMIEVILLGIFISNIIWIIAT